MARAHARGVSAPLLSWQAHPVGTSGRSTRGLWDPARPKVSSPSRLLQDVTMHQSAPCGRHRVLQDPGLQQPTCPRPDNCRHPCAGIRSMDTVLPRWEARNPLREVSLHRRSCSLNCTSHWTQETRKQAQLATNHQRLLQNLFISLHQLSEGRCVHDAAATEYAALYAQRDRVGRIQAALGRGRITLPAKKIPDSGACAIRLTVFALGPGPTHAF